MAKKIAEKQKPLLVSERDHQYMKLLSAQKGIPVKAITARLIARLRTETRLFLP